MTASRRSLLKLLALVPIPAFFAGRALSTGATPPAPEPPTPQPKPAADPTVASATFLINGIIVSQFNPTNASFLVYLKTDFNQVVATVTQDQWAALPIEEFSYNGVALGDPTSLYGLKFQSDILVPDGSYDRFGQVQSAFAQGGQNIQLAVYLGDGSGGANAAFEIDGVHLIDNSGNWSTDGVTETDPGTLVFAATAVKLA